jgi:photosystem II stability/assembly factor-like uncharacterized protein
VLISSDGAMTWSMSSLPAGTQRAEINDMACASELRCVAATDASKKEADLLATADGGVTWEEHPVSGNSPLQAVSCAEQACMAAGVDGDELKTFTSSDGGNTWSRSGSPKVDAQEVADLACPVPGRCYVTTSTNEPEEFKLFTTNDNGATWTDRTPPDELLVDELACTDEDACLLLGYGDILQTTDGGQHWEERYVGFADNPPSAITCSASSLCLAFEGGSFAVVSRDGGRTWSRELLPAETLTSVVAASCALASGCVAIGEHKYIAPPVATPADYRFDAVILLRPSR